MIVPDSAHQIAAAFGQIRPHDEPGRRDVETCVVQQLVAHLAGRQMRIGGDDGYPERVDLHDPQVFAAVLVDVDDAGPTALDGLNRRKHPGRQTIDLRDERHAYKERNSHVYSIQWLRRMNVKDRVKAIRFRRREGVLSRLHCTAHSQQGEATASQRSKAGFTLLEILVVIAILGLLIGLVAPAALRQLSGARVSVATQSLERLTLVLDLYKLDVGSYPTTDQGLAALTSKPANAGNWNGPYLKGEAQPLDPWNHPYMYESPARNGRELLLCSKGPTGVATDASNGLICNK
jgi:general secretion pathway protein G